MSGKTIENAEGEFVSVKEDKVNHPSHYTFGEIEVIDYIKDKLTGDEYVGYCMGNVLKYSSRWRHKGGLEDLKKAQVYLGWAIEAVEESLKVPPISDTGYTTSSAAVNGWS